VTSKARIAMSVSILGLAMAMSPSALAQTADAKSDVRATDKEIIVTAQFREQNLQDTPIAITAMNAEMLEQRGQVNIVDIAAQAPSVTLKPGGGIFGPALQAYIRGIGQYDNNLGYEPGVGLYVDDVYFSTLTGSVLNLVDVDRVEVLRGPQGTLAGKNSIGGAIKIFSQKPKGDGSGYLRAEYGRFNSIEVRGAADFALTPNLAVRLSGVGHSSKGYIKRIDYACENPGSGVPSLVQSPGNCQLGTEGGRSYVGGRLALRWTPSPAVEINLSGDYTHDTSEAVPNQLLGLPNGVGATAAAPAGSPYAGQVLDSRFITAGQYKTYSTYCNPYAAFGAYCLDNTSGFSPWGVQGTVDIKLSDSLSLKSITSYRGYDGAFVYDNDASPLVTSPGFNTLRQKQFTQELRLSGKVGDLLDFTVGGFVLDAKNNNGGIVDIAYIFSGFGHVIDDDVRNKSQAAFLQAELHLNDRLNFIGGLRYTHESKDYHYVRQSLFRDGTTAFPTGIGVDNTTGKFAGNRTDYRIGVNYKLTDDILAYAQFSTGFKGGGTNPRPFFANQLFGFGPETVESFEGGLKTEFADRRVRLNLAGYHSNYKDVQLVLLACPTAPCAGPQNVGNAHINGFEAEINAEPVDGFKIDGSLSYTDFKYYKINASTIFPGAGASVGLDDVNPFVSKWKWSIGAQYEIGLPGGSSVTPRIDGSYQSSYYTDPNNGVNNLVNGYDVWNGRLTYRSADRNWQVSLEVSNLFNKYYYVSYNDNVAFNGLIFGAAGRPREWAVSVKRSF